MERYDAVIVGARCAGSTAAIALARGGWDVLVIDRDDFPSDTVSTHGLWPNTVARLEELGALELMQSRHRINFLANRMVVLDHELTGEFSPVDGHTKAIAPRRRVLDTALLDSARAAGAEARLGEKVIGLIGAGTEAEPVRGVETEGGGEIEARWVIGADGRGSAVAKSLGLERERPLAGEMCLVYAYWRGIPERPCGTIHAECDRVLTWAAAEDDICQLTLNLPPDATRGSHAERERRYLAELRRFPKSLDPEAIDAAELVSEIQPVPETMLRGYFRRPAGPGWALVGDSCHFKHPSTAQGISDAIEQALFVSEALLEERGLDDYESWRNERAAEHYEWSFSFASFPTEGGDVIFGALERDPEAQQQFRDILPRVSRPRSDVFTPERLERWFSEGAAKA